jgi:hypothetical protein
MSTDVSVTIDRPGDRGSVEATFLFDLIAELEPRVEIGPGPLGRRVFDRVRAGTFSGPHLRGELLPGSGDPLLFRADGVAVIDARAVLRTDDGAHILMTYVGRVVIPDAVRPAVADVDTRHEVDPTRYYIRTLPVFETGAPAYSWLNGIVAVGYGYLAPGGGVGYRVFAVS